MIWDIVRKKLEDAGIGQSGVDMFEESFPATVNKGIMLRSPLTGIVIDPHIPGFHKPLMQVILRDTDIAAGKVKAKQILDVLTVTEIKDYPATADRMAVRLSVFYPKTLPIQYPRLDGNSVEWSMNFITAFGFRR